jgi:UDP-N-acetylglucosamine 1-carboxyvinyltransferase
MEKNIPTESRLIVTGNRRLEGTVLVSGSKYSAVLAIIAAFLSPAGAVLRNIPKIGDVDALLAIGEFLEVQITRREQGVIVIDASGMRNRLIPPKLTGKLHSSYLFLPVLASRFGSATVGLPGGCRVDENRYPIEIAELYGRFGFEMELDPEHNLISAVRKGKPLARRELDFSSISYRDITMFTKTAVVLAATTPGVTVIRRPFMGPEIRDMASALCRMGPRVWGAGAEILFVEGTAEFRPVDHEILTDWTEGLTLLATAFLTGGHVTVDNLPVRWMGSELAALSWMGAELEFVAKTEADPNGTGSVSCTRGKALQTVRLSTSTYPGLNTDSHPILAACLTQSPGRSTIVERVFSRRAVYVESFRKMNALVECDGNTVAITGPTRLRSAAVCGHDIRTCASLLLLSLAAEGETIIDEWHHLKRGYEDLPGKLRSLGGQIIEAQA